MNLYSPDEERAIRAHRRVEDWVASGLLEPAQRDQILPSLHVDLRRTNRFLRATLFVFGFMIVNAAAGLVAVVLDFTGPEFKWLSLLASVTCAAAAQGLVRRYRLYHFGVEEAVAIAAVPLFVVFAATVGVKSDFSAIVAFAAAAIGSWLLFLRFGYLYAGVAATLLAPMVVFASNQTDTVRRVAAFALLLTIVVLARRRQRQHDDEYPGDAYGIIAAVAWGAMYFIANLKISGWWSIADGGAAFEWTTYAVVWLVPIAGLWIAIRDRQRALLDVNIVAALVTLVTSKAYLGFEQKPWDPVVFGVMLIATAIGTRRWLAGGAGGSRRGFVAERLLASERERLRLAGSATVIAPGPPAAHARAAGPTVGGGGASGGAGATGNF